MFLLLELQIRNIERGGVEINAFQIGLSYGLVLGNISPNSEGGSLMCTNVASHIFIVRHLLSWKN
jgi:hypothetical protein